MSSAIRVGPATLDLTLYAGDGFMVGFQFVDKDTGGFWPVPGEWTAQVRAPANSPDVVLDFTVDTVDAPNGKIVLSLTGEQVRTLLPVVNGQWDLQQVEPGAEPRTWYRGKIVAVQDVTRVGLRSDV